MATAQEAVTVLNKLGEELRKRQSDNEALDKAYRGEFKLTFASEDFRDYFGTRYQKFADNWTAIVADAPHERLEPIGIRLKGAESGDGPLWDIWRENDADALSDLAMLDAIISKRSFAQVWGDPETDETVINWGHPSQMIVGYDPATRARISGGHIWSDDVHDYAQLDWAGFLWKFKRRRTDSFAQAGFVLPGHLEGNWEPRQESTDDTWPIPNPMGKVSFVEMANRPRLVGEPSSDISGTLSMQHAINLLWAQLFAVSDEATLGQRILIGGEMPKIPILNEAGDVVGERPVDLKKLRQDNLLWVEGDAKPHQWQPANLKAFTDIIEIAVGHIAAQTRTPAHYLLIGGTIANVSGDAMKALETGLVKRTEEKTQHFGRAIRDVFELVALAGDDKSKAAQVRGGQVLWKDVENRSDAQRADALSKKRDIGYPLRYLLELDGLPPTEIDRVMGMVESEQSDPFALLDPATRASLKADSGDAEPLAGA